MVSASRRSIVESAGSFSRSSIRVPNAACVASRTSFQRSIAATTWMPYPPPLLQQIRDLVGLVLEVLAQGAEPVDDQDDVGGDELRHAAGRVGRAQRVDRVDAVPAEHLLAVVKHRRGPPRPCGGPAPGRSAVATPPTCGIPASARRPAPARSNP